MWWRKLLDHYSNWRDDREERRDEAQAKPDFLASVERLEKSTPPQDKRTPEKLGARHRAHMGHDGLASGRSAPKDRHATEP